MLTTLAVLMSLSVGPPLPGIPSRLRILAESKDDSERTRAARWLGEVGPEIGKTLCDANEQARRRTKNLLEEGGVVLKKIDPTTAQRLGVW